MHRFPEARAWLRRLTALCLIAGIAAPAPVLAADWFYRVRPQDTIWALTRHYLKPAVSWRRLQTYNHVTDPYHLPPGSQLRIPVAWLKVQPAKATIVAVAGQVTLERPGPSGAMTRSAATAGMKLAFGSRLSTADHASLTLEFADGSRLLMQNDSELTLDRMSAYGDTGMADTHLRLQHGRISNAVTPMPGNDAHFTVQTPNSISSVRGTHFRVATDPGQAQTEVLIGHVDVAGQRHHVKVDHGSGVRVLAHQRPGHVRRLLPRPSLTCPTEPIGKIGFALRWPALPKAAHYRVQIAAGEQFQTLLMNRVVDAPRINLPDLPNGDYAIRLHGVDDVGLEGFDTTCRLPMAAHPQPPLVQQPQPGSKVRDKRPVFRWTESTKAKSYAWQLSGDAHFTHLLAERAHVQRNHVPAPDALPPGQYYWRVASRDAQGTQGPYSDPIAFQRVDPPAAPTLSPPERSSRGLTLSWPGASGQRYRIQLAADSAFSHPSVDWTLAQATATLPEPGAGTWYVRIRSIDSDGYAGPWGAAQKIHIGCPLCRIAAGLGGGALLWILL